MKILVTGANGDIGEAVGRILIEAFPHALVHGADAAGKWPGGFIFQKMSDLPYASDLKYIEKLSNLAKEYDLIIPTSEPELVILSKEIDIQKKIPLLMVSPVILKLFLDKYDTAFYLEKAGFNPPKTKLLNEANLKDLPLYVKPRRGAGSKGHSLVINEAELKYIKQTGQQNLVAQEFIDGEDNEYTCALFRGQNIFRSIILKRKLQGDKSIIAQVENITSINNLLSQLAEIMDLRGNINVQFKLTQEGARIFEINPRLSSTVMMRNLLGFKDLIWWIEDFFHQQISKYIEPKNGSCAYRMSTEKVILL